MWGIRETILSIIVCVFILLGMADTAISEESPEVVASAFVEALVRLDYAELVTYVDKGWINRELAAQGWPSLDSPVGVREDFVRGYLGPTKCGTSGIKLPDISELWANRKWPSVFPPEYAEIIPERGWCGTGDPGSKVVAPSNNVAVFVENELVQGRHGTIVVEALRSRDLTKATIEIELEKNRWGKWFVTEVETR